MTHPILRTRLLASSMITSAALAAATGAFAQAAAPAAPPPTTTGTPAATVGELVVTGSRIPQPNLTSIAPVTAVTNQELQLTGTTRVEDLINQLPQVVAEQGAMLANGASGTATVSLRDLGSKRTLVLVDGRRLVPGDPAFPVPDLNFIPAQLVDRVEVDMAGASAVYGADAVAGVVNFIMKRNFEGVRLDANYGIYENDNGDAAAQAAEAAKNFGTPNGSVWDGKTWDIAAIIGVNSPDGKGNVEGYLEYRHFEAVLQGTRDYSACTMGSSGNALSCSGSSTNPNGRFLPYNAAGTSFSGDWTLNKAVPGNLTTFGSAYLFNYGALNYFQRPDERYSGGFFAHYDISPMFQPYAEFMFMDDHTVAQIAPSGAFLNTYSIPCNDPLLSADEVNKLCTVNGLGPTQQEQVVIGRRNVEGGNRQDDLRHTDYRAVIGMKGDLNENWHYDVYGQYGASILSENYLNDVSKIKIARALDVIPNPAVGGDPAQAVGAPVCASDTSIAGNPPVDTTCVPWNIWTPGGVSQAAVNYISAPGFQEAQMTEQVVSGSVTGDLGPYGIKSPYAKDGVGIAVGAEYRRETEDFRNDLEFLTGDLAGQGAASPNVHGEYDVKEVFGEARIPFIEDMTGFKNLSAELGYRFSHYSTAGDHSAYKITGDWAINDDIRIRGGFNRSVRAPNILELFTPQRVALDGTTDNCAGATPVWTAAQCALTGVTAAQYGKIIPNPAQQYNGLLGGNPNLQPETANTYSVGVVLTPHEFLRGFTASADYFNVKINNVIQGYGEDNILKACAVQGVPFFCSLIHRNNTGSLWLGTIALGLPTTGYVVDTTQNAGYLKTSGIDFAANYHFNFRDFGMGDWGGVAIDFLGTWTHEYKIFSGIPGGAVTDCAGLYGSFCQGTSTPMSGPLPHWKHKMRLTWSTPVDGLEVSLAWRYLGPVNVDTGASGAIDTHIEAYNWFDLAGQWRFKDRYTLRAGINNLFDRDPPIITLPNCPVVVCSGNTFPQVYDSLGRYVFVGLTADF
ncbi:MAG TPA: TonB-dependent receptor [Caulobacteraceae bacterium]|nr:TonB-dependent receptor [Caulobacteraceae bacterium]